MSVIKRFVILENRQKSLETTIDFLLNCRKYSWDKIYLFSAFVSNNGVDQVKKILLHPYLNENTEVVIAIGKKGNFNNPSDIQDLLNFIDQESKKIKTKSVSFICPIHNFHIKAYFFLGRRVTDNKEIGFSIIGSSNLTQLGLECEGELCISIHHLNLTKQFIYCLSDKYAKSPPWKQEIENYLSVQEKSTLVDQAPRTSTPQNGKFLKLGVLTDIALIDKATNLVNGRENIDWFYFAHRTIEQAKEDFPEGSLCLLLTENKIFQIGEIISYEDDKQQTHGCFTIFKFNVKAFSYDDIREILEKEEYKKIKIAEEEYEEYITEKYQYPELEYATLNMFEEEVKEHLKIIRHPNYKQGLERGKKDMQSKFKSEIERIISKNDPNSMIEELKKLSQSL